MIEFRHKGDFSNLKKFLNALIGRDYRKILERYAQEGVVALAAATPKDSGKTASSWYYEIIQNKDSMSVVWKNSNIVDGVNIAIILQYGHGTRNGGYVQGLDYINPALKPIFEKMADMAWKEVSNP